MFKLVKLLNHSTCRASYLKKFTRKFLSQAYQCNEVWEHRLNDPVLQKVNVDEIYFALDQRFQKTRQMSAVDVDIYANAVTEDIHVDELLDLVHKLRLTADTGNTLNSTSHAVIRYLSGLNEDPKLLDALDDRLNYGLFLDHYTANLLMDKYWKSKDFVSGARVASQLMLQEDVGHPLYAALAMIHCYNYLLKPGDWPQPAPPEEPEEEVKVRVKYLRNEYFDDHFDLRDPKKIVGKTLMMLTKNKPDALDQSFHILGLALYDKPEQAKSMLAKMNKSKIYPEVFNVLPEDNEIRLEAQKLPAESGDVQKLLTDRVKAAERQVAEKDVAEQCKTFLAWEDERKQALERQIQRLTTQKRLAEMEEARKKLADKEMQLWFFENEEKMELEIEEKEELLEKEKPVEHTKKTSSKNIDEDYIPPEVGRGAS